MTSLTAPEVVEAPAPRPWITTRDVTQAECPWLDLGVAEGTIVYPYRGYTYGTVGPFGRAVSLVPDTLPFFELPWKAIEVHG